MKIYTIQKTRFLEWYFESGQDQENEEIRKELGEKVVNSLFREGFSHIITRDIFDICNQEAIKTHFLEEFDEDSEKELGDLDDNCAVVLIDKSGPKVAITGHRPNKLGNDYEMLSPLAIRIKRELQHFINFYKPSVMISGMALGIDTLWAELAIENNIPLVAAIPCINHSVKWNAKHIATYNKILEHPLTTLVLLSEEEYTESCMQARNEWMVDTCDMLVAVWDGTKGGTANCVSYANSVSKSPVLTLDPENYR